MKLDRQLGRRLRLTAIALLVFAGAVYSDSADMQMLLQQVDNYPHTQQIDYQEREVIDHEVGLGAIQKLRGEWDFKHSERLTGTLTTYTWLIGNGYSSAEVMAAFLDNVEETVGCEMLFSCEGRACGRAVQWANGVFGERVLYGREGLQRYRVCAVDGEPAARLIAYSAERTADRQYLHVEWLVIKPQ